MLNSLLLGVGGIIAIIAAIVVVIALVGCIHRMWVYNNLHRDPTKVRSIYLDQNYELKQLDNLSSVSAFLAEIRDDIHNMVEAEMEGFISLRDFPPSPGDRCDTCQFFKFCQKRDTFKDKSLKHISTK